MRAAGCDHGIENRRVMCGLIWLPRPRTKRPPEAACRSHAVWASVIGLRANATAIDGPQVDPLGALRGQQQRQERVVARLGGQHAVVAARLSSAAACAAAVSSPPMPPSIFMNAT